MGTTVPVELPHLDGVLKVRLDGPPRVRVRDAERDGVYCLGVRTGAVRHPTTRPAVRGDRIKMMARGGRSFFVPKGDELYLDYSNDVGLGVFDSWCLNCGRRVRVCVPQGSPVL